VIARSMAKKFVERANNLDATPMRHEVELWLSGEKRIPEAARCLLKAEVSTCRVASYLEDRKLSWQGFRDGQICGPLVETREQAFRNTWRTASPSEDCVR
jgi:hypothetical protein